MAANEQNHITHHLGIAHKQCQDNSPPGQLPTVQVLVQMSGFTGL